MNKGIYAIICKVNGKMYIGYSFNFKSRKKTHWGKMAQNKYKGKNDQLQNDWNLYGKSNFKFVIIEEVNTDSINEMLQKEEDYIIRFGTLFEDKGYNISLPVSKQFRKGFVDRYGKEFLRELVCSNDDFLLKEDWVAERGNKQRMIYQINRENEVVRIWENRESMSRELGITLKSAESMIFMSSRGKGKYRRTYRGHVWVYENKYNQDIDYSTAFHSKPRNRKVKPMKAQKNKIDSSLQKKPISLQNTETGDIWNFESRSQAERILGFRLQSLLKGWKQKGKGKRAFITQWKGWKIYK